MRVSIIGFLMLFFFYGPGVAYNFGSFSSSDDSFRVRRTGKAFTRVAKSASSAVVFVQVEKEIQPRRQSSPYGYEDFFNDEFFKQFFGDAYGRYEKSSPQSGGNIQNKKQIAGQGSGFIVSNDGYILTNSHVVGEANLLKVILPDGREFKATLIGRDVQSDVAVIKIEATDLPTLSLGDSEALEVGEWVLAIGNPFGLSNSLTAGIVSAKGRHQVGISHYENFIQTDAAINPGNSGGPLLNLEGDVVGMNTAIFSRSGGYMGIGFAIPSSMLRSIMDQLIRHGDVVRGFLGVAIQDLTSELRSSFSLSTREGVLVSQVEENSPAQKAGLKQGDVILSFKGKKVSKVHAFRHRVALTPPGTLCDIEVLRQGRLKRISVTIGRLGQQVGVKVEPLSPVSDDIGLMLRDLSVDERRQRGLGLKRGVLVTDVLSGSLAEMVAIRPGAIILQMNQQDLSSVADFKQKMSVLSRPSVVLLLVYQNGYMRYITVTLN
ncbi:MAG: DegQ family serine endoprotease [bacterium]